MSQLIPTQPLPEQDRIELMIARTVIPRLSTIEGQMQVFNNLLTQIATRQKEEQERLSRKVEELQKVIKGDADNDGLVARVNDLGRWVEGEKKWLWIVISALTIETIGIFILVARSVLKVP